MGLNSGSVYVESNTSLWKKLDEFHDQEPCVPDPLLQSFILPENNIQIYTVWWIFYALWLVVANDLLEYRHMDDVSRLILFKMARSFENVYEIILD